MSVLSLDFGGSSVKFAVVSDQGKMGEVNSFPAPLNTKEQAADLVKQIFDSCTEPIEGIGVSLPGFIDEEGTLIGSGAYTNLWGCNVAKLFSDKCGVPVTVLNDGKSGAMAETWGGALNGCKDGIVMIIGTAIAGGIIKDGQVHFGKDYGAGEFSFIQVKNEGFGLEDTLSFASGMFGMTYKMCLKKNLNLDVQDSAPLLRVTDIAYRKAHPETPEWKDVKDIKADGKQMFVWLEEGDADIIEIYNECIRSLAMTAMNLQTIYGPEKIAIGGGITRQKRVVEDIRAEVDRIYASYADVRPVKPEVVPCYYVAEPNIIGAARYFYMKRGN